MSWRHTYERKLVQANIDTQNEIAGIIESNLHYVVDGELRTEAMQYLVDTRMDQWRREAEDIDLNQSIIMFPEGPEGRPRFHQRVAKVSDEMGDEFRKLSDGRETAAAKFWSRP